MARPERNDVDYFPHECNHGKKMFIIEQKFGNDGYATWFKILEELAKSNYHFIDLRDHQNMMYIVSICRISEEKFKEIALTLSNLGSIDKSLYDNYQIIWSQKFIDSIQDAYNRRNNKCITLSGLCRHLQINDGLNDVSVEQKTTKNRIAKNRIVKNRIVKGKKHKYGEFKNVLLVDEDLVKLKEKLGESRALEMIKKLDEGIELKGYYYKSHYLAILKWHKDNKEKGESHNGFKPHYKRDPGFIEAPPGKYAHLVRKDV